MKTYIYSLLIFCIPFFSLAQISQDKNYILYKVYNEPVQAGNESATSNTSQIVNYFDGKGRIIQQNAIKTGGAGEDIISYNEYDNFGRQQKNYLALPLANNQGAYVNNILNNINGYYNADKYDYTENPYTESRFGFYDIGNTIETAHPGNSYEIASGKTKKATRITNTLADMVHWYSTGYNANDPIVLYNGYYANNKLYKYIYRNENWVAADGNRNSTHIFYDFQGRKVLKRNFNGNEILDTYYVYDDRGDVMFIIPPHVTNSMLTNGGTTIPPEYIYSNLSQQVDLSTNAAQDFLTNPGTGYITYSITNDVLTITFNATFPQSTLNFNHQTPNINSSVPLPDMFLGNLNCGPNLPGLVKVRIVGNALLLEQNYAYNYVTSFSGTFTIPLSSVTSQVTTNTDVINKYCYQYRYDNKNRLSQKKLPGIDWTYIVYDYHNRVALTQTGNQRETGTWSFVKYEYMGRPAFSGTLYDTNFPFYDREQMQELVDNDFSLYTRRTTTPVNISGTSVYYTYDSDYEVLFVRDINYYDNYNFNTEGLGLPASVYGEAPMTRTQGLLTGTKTQAGDGEGGTPPATSIYGYDRKGRLNYIAAKDPYLQTSDVTELKLDFIGQLLESKTTHTKTGVITGLVTYDNFTYDATGRLLKHYQKVGSNPTELLTSNKYDELGVLAEKRVGGGYMIVSVTGIGLSNGIFTKTANTASWTNAAITGTSALVNNGKIMFTVGSSTTNQLNIGLSYSPASTAYNQINYAIALTNTNHASGGKTLNIQETGTTKFTTNYYPNDELTIERAGNVVYYIKNGTLIYQSLVAATASNLFADAHFYNVGSNIANLKLYNGAYASTNALQNIKYSYNVRGKLTDINDISSSGNLFKMQIRYDNPTTGTGATPYYNGNISQVFWKTANDPSNTLRNYNYAYDGLHRFISANYIKTVGTATTTGMYNETVSYDKAGNITSLTRSGGNDATVVNIDALSYNYNGNQLIKVTDGTSNTLGFKDGANLATEYTYDLNGNMKSDANKGITSITYNDLDLPVRITFTGTNRYIQFMYDSYGNKLSKYVRNGTNTTYTEYAKGYVYVSVNGQPAQLQYASQPEGYVSHVAGNFSYVYQYTDHLGNIRLSYTDNDKNGIVATSEIIEENNYYPFGLKHTGYNSAYNPLGNAYNKYGFQGQDLQDDMGLNWLSFKWRNYDPAVGRFFNIDPLAEKYNYLTPYQFSSNQVIHAPELEGMESYEEQTDEERELFEQIHEVACPDCPDEFDEILSTVCIGCQEDDFEKVDEDDEPHYLNGMENTEVEDRDDMIEDALEVGSYLPFGGLIDIYRGLRDGNMTQFAMGVLSVGIDAATLGSGSAVKAGVKAAAKEVAKEVAEEGAERIAKEVVKEATEEGVKKGNRVFWSGEGAEKAALEYANKTEGKTLEMTRAAKNLKKLIETKNIPWEEARPMWKRLSSKFAEGAGHTVDFFPGKTVSPTSIWMETELPILMDKATNIIIH